MPFAKNGNVTIHYEIHGAGQPLLLHHGIMGSIESWKITGWIRSLQDDFQLIVMDARGHGQSDKPHDPQSYYPKWLSRDAIAVLDDLGLESVHAFGYSFGGWISYGHAIYHPQRFRSIVIGGMHPFSHERGHPQRWISLLQEGGIERFLEDLEVQSGQLPNTVKAIFRKNDVNAIIALLQRMITEDTLYRHLGEIKIPMLVYAGSEDDMLPLIRRAADSIATARFVVLKGLTHRTAFTRRDVIEPVLREFLLSI